MRTAPSTYIPWAGPKGKAPFIAGPSVPALPPLNGPLEKVIRSLGTKKGPPKPKKLR